MRDDDTPCCGPKFWVYLVICLILVAFAGLTSGLSLGLFSYSQVDLEVLIKAGLPQEKKNAARILPIVKNEYLLLCTLLIAKSLALETVPVFLDTILPFSAAILVSVSFVMAFAEVIPQAVCSRYGLSLSAKFVLFVRFLLLLLFPVSSPVSKLLNWLLGKGHSELLRRAQLKTLVDLHSIKAGKGGELTDDETTIIAGALDMTEKTVKDAMTPISKTFSLDMNSKLDMHTMGLIVSEGHSRVPIYSENPNNIIALLLVKNLIFYHPEDEIPVKNVTLWRIPRVYDNWPLYDVLKLFQKGHSHMAVVVKSEKDTKETEERIKSTPNLLRTSTHSNMEPAAAVSKEILDESDLNVLNKIRINFLPWKRSHSTSPKVASVPQPYSKTPATSPFSSYYHSPILRSPISLYIPSPLVRPILYASPTKSRLSSPAGSAGPVSSSPSSRQVSRISYERLRPTGAS